MWKWRLGLPAVWTTCYGNVKRDTGLRMVYVQTACWLVSISTWKSLFEFVRRRTIEVMSRALELSSIATLPCLVNKLACSKALISLRRLFFPLITIKAHRYSSSSTSFCILLFLLNQPSRSFCTTYHCTRRANNSKIPCPTSQVGKPCYIHTPILSLYHVHLRARRVSIFSMEIP